MRRDESARRAGRDESGAATMAAVGLAGFLLLLGLVGAWATASFARHRSVQAAADLAALAGAAAEQRGEDGCSAAGRVAADNAAEVERCRVRGSDVWLTVRMPGPSLLGWRVTLQGRARAGPDP